jgi:hypothetical protein
MTVGPACRSAVVCGVAGPHPDTNPGSEAHAPDESALGTAKTLTNLICGADMAKCSGGARATGVPARAVVEYWAISGIDQPHVEAEFYLEGLGWILVDPTIGQLQRSKRDYYFGHMDDHRVSLNKGSNVPLDAPADGWVAPSTWPSP